jgi:hypothetical protein
MTIEGRLYKDAETGATYKIASQIARQWLEQDRATAAEQPKPL